MAACPVSGHSVVAPAWVPRDHSATRLAVCLILLHARVYSLPRAQRAAVFSTCPGGSDSHPRRSRRAAAA